MSWRSGLVAGGLALSLAACTDGAPIDIAGLADSVFGRSAGGSASAAAWTGNFERGRFRYTAPATAPRAASQVVVPRSSAAARDSVVSALELANFDIQRRNRNLVVARYQGDAGRLVDCGVFERVASRERVAATTASWSANVAEPAGATLEREMDLHVLAVVELNALGAGTTRVAPTFIYALAKDVRLIGRDGTELTRTPEVVSFKSDDSGLFRAGTRCVASGVLENALLTLLAQQRPVDGTASSLAAAHGAPATVDDSDRSLGDASAS